MCYVRWRFTRTTGKYVTDLKPEENKDTYTHSQAQDMMSVPESTYYIRCIFSHIEYIQYSIDIYLCLALFLVHLCVHMHMRVCWCMCVRELEGETKTDTTSSVFFSISIP